MRAPLAKHELQRTCEHPATELVARADALEPVGDGLKQEIVLDHLHCFRCGMFFARVTNRGETV